MIVRIGPCIVLYFSCIWYGGEAEQNKSKGGKYTLLIIGNKS